MRGTSTGLRATRPCSSSGKDFQQNVFRAHKRVVSAPSCRLSTAASGQTHSNQAKCTPFSPCPLRTAPSARCVVAHQRTAPPILPPSTGAFPISEHGTSQRCLLLVTPQQHQHHQRVSEYSMSLIFLNALTCFIN